VEKLLAEAGPMTEGELLSALFGAGVDLGEDPADTLAEMLDSEEMPFVLPLIDGRQVLLTALLAGRVFTHRLEPAEIEHDFLAITPDLAPLSMLIDTEPYQNFGGVELVEVDAMYDAELLDERGIPIDAVPEPGAYLLPPGHLRAVGFGPGDLMGVRVTAQGFGVEVIDERVGAAEPPSGLGPRLDAILAARPDPDVPDQLDAAIWTACADDPELFREPLPPLGRMLDTVGIPYDEDEIAPTGFDFEAWRVEDLIESIQYRHDLDDDEALAVLAMVSMYEQVAELVDAVAAADVDDEDVTEPDDGRAELPGPVGTELPAGLADTADAGLEVVDSDQGRRRLVASALELLADPGVAEAVLAETIGIDREGAPALGVFAQTLEELAPVQARPAVRWLRGKAHERLGDPLQAEEAFQAAHALAPTWPPALFDLARYAGDRGDAAGGLALLRQARAGNDDSLVEMLQHFQPKPRPGVGRNHACWCGSGRKYKLCHLNRERLPLAERAAWLYQKAGLHLVDGPWRVAILEVAAQRARHSTSPAALLAACQDALVTDSVLFEGGAFEEFLAVRGVLLPDDERLLAGQWLLVERSVYEVEDVRAGHGLTVRDLRTGDRQDVQERTASRDLKIGMLICARILPAGDASQIFGGVEVIGLHERDELIDLLDTHPDPPELVAFLSRRLAPPQLQNTEGDPIVMCRATLRVPDPQALSRSLDDTYDRENADDDTDASHAPAGPTAQWFEHVETHGMQRIRATLRLSGDELHIDTNSEARLDRVIDTIRSLQPSATVLDESREPVSDLHAAAGPAGPGSPPVGAGNLLDPTDPDLAPFVEQLALQYEQSWLDEPIPALAGHTPRQAAADPTRRPDLIRLLDTFPQTNGAGLMSPDRLRGALGLA
jgi:tetratricopeptide (TPR) repeat protein